MKKTNNKREYTLGIPVDKREKIIREVVKKSNDDQLKVIERHGGLKILHRYCECD